LLPKFLRVFPKVPLTILVNSSHNAFALSAFEILFLLSSVSFERIESNESLSSELLLCLELFFIIALYFSFLGIPLLSSIFSKVLFFSSLFNFLFGVSNMVFAIWLSIFNHLLIW
jgi:hypothetical protein